MASIRVSYMTPRHGQEARVAELLGRLSERAVALLSELLPLVDEDSHAELAFEGEPHRAGGRRRHAVPRRVARGVLVEVHNALPAGGAPVPPEQLERLFDRFYQADPGRGAGRHRGLGLSIVHELVQAHGGTVSIESTAERGTTASVFLPTHGPAVEPARVEAARPSAPSTNANQQQESV